MDRNNLNSEKLIFSIDDSDNLNQELVNSKAGSIRMKKGLAAFIFVLFITVFIKGFNFYEFLGLAILMMVIFYILVIEPILEIKKLESDIYGKIKFRATGKIIVINRITRKIKLDSGHIFTFSDLKGLINVEKDDLIDVEYLSTSKFVLNVRMLESKFKSAGQ